MSHYPPGLQPVPRNPAVLPYKESDSKLSSVDDLVIPESQLITAAKEFLRPELGEHIWNHSHRAFLFATAIAKTQLADYIEYDSESFYLTCLFHDLGCTPKNINRTKLSFEFFGAIEARQWLLSHGANADLADSVAEAIFRHTDFNKGMISCNGQLIQLGTLFDNIHAHAKLLPQDLVGSIITAYPRPGWGGCFARTMQAEVEHKPWCHASELRESDAWHMILGNALAKAE